MAAGPTRQQIQRGTRNMALRIAATAQHQGYDTIIQKRKKDRGPIVQVIDRASQREIGRIECTTIHASNGEAFGYYHASRATGGNYGNTSSKNVMEYIGLTAGAR